MLKNIKKNKRKNEIKKGKKRKKRALLKKDSKLVGSNT